MFCNIFIVGLMKLYNLCPYSFKAFNPQIAILILGLSLNPAFSNLAQLCKK